MQPYIWGDDIPISTSTFFFQTDGLVETTNLIYNFYLDHLTPKKGTEPRHHVDRFVAVFSWGGCQLCGGWPIHNWWSFGVAFGREAKIPERCAGREVYGQGGLGCFFFLEHFLHKKKRGGGLGGLARWDSNERFFIRKLAAIPPFCRSWEMIPNFLLMSLNSTWLRRCCCYSDQNPGLMAVDRLYLGILLFHAHQHPLASTRLRSRYPCT